MKSAIFTYLKSYSSIPFEVDSLIVSTFLAVNNISVIHNSFLKSYIIDQSDDKKNQRLLLFIQIINNEIDDFTIEKLIELFEFVISPSDRIVNGAIYTPPEIRNYIVSEVISAQKNTISDMMIADISCGCSGFLYTAAKEIKKKTGRSYRDIFQFQIFGLDIQGYSIVRSKVLLSLLALSEGEDIEEFDFNLYQGDALAFKWKDYYKNFEGFHAIIWNPPYVRTRNLDDSVKENLKNWSVAQIWNPDLYIPFFQIGYENLLKNGILGFITMNSFFKSLNWRLLRRYFEENQVSMKIIDFGTLQIFQSKSTYTCICFLENIKEDSIFYYKSIQKWLPKSLKEYSSIKYSQLDAINGWNLNNNVIVSQIESTGIPFGKIFKTRHGIATLKNNIYIFKPIREDSIYYYLQNEDEIYPIEKGICKSILNTNRLSRNVSLEDIVEKIIFPYDNTGKPKLLKEDIIEAQFPKTLQYLKKKKDILAKRDKGKGKYENWYAFGRTQSLECVNAKLFFPKISDRVPSYLMSIKDDLLFYNWQAIIGHSEKEMLFIKKLMGSRIFWYYITSTSKPYAWNYYSLNGNYIRNFGVCTLDDTEMDFVLKETDPVKLNIFFEEKYNVHFMDDSFYIEAQ